MKLTQNEAGRVTRVIDSRIAKRVQSGAYVEHTLGTVNAIAAGRQLSALIYEETDPAYASEGFRIPGPYVPSAGDKVVVAMDKVRGDKYVKEVVLSGDYHKVYFGTDGKLYFGDGTAAGDVTIYRNADGTLHWTDSSAVDHTLSHPDLASHDAMGLATDAELSTHAGLTDVHHAKSHGHTGADGSGTVSHDNLTGVSADDHHAQLHAASHAGGGADALGAGVAVGVSSSNSAGSATTWARSDHRHDLMGGFGTPIQTSRFLGPGAIAAGATVDQTITLGTAFSSGNYTPIVIPQHDATTGGKVHCSVRSFTASTVTIAWYNAHTASITPTGGLLIAVLD